METTKIVVVAALMLTMFCQPVFAMGKNHGRVKIEVGQLSNDANGKLAVAISGRNDEHHAVECTVSFKYALVSSEYPTSYSFEGSRRAPGSVFCDPFHITRKATLKLAQDGGTAQTFARVPFGVGDCCQEWAPGQCHPWRARFDVIDEKPRLRDVVCKSASE